jgi:hypothetical protein
LLFLILSLPVCCSTSSLHHQTHFHTLLIMANFLTHGVTLGDKPFYKLSL